MSTRPPTRFRASTTSTDRPLPATSRAATRPAMPGADHDDVDLLRERSLAGPAQHRGLGVGRERAGAEQRGAGGGAAQQGAAGEAWRLEHNRHMALNEWVAR